MARIELTIQQGSADQWLANLPDATEISVLALLSAISPEERTAVDDERAALLAVHSAKTQDLLAAYLMHGTHVRTDLYSRHPELNKILELISARVAQKGATRAFEDFVEARSPEERLMHLATIVGREMQVFGERAAPVPDSASTGRIEQSLKELIRFLNEDFSRIGIQPGLNWGDLKREVTRVPGALSRLAESHPDSFSNDYREANTRLRSVRSRLQELDLAPVVPKLDEFFRSLESWAQRVFADSDLSKPAAIEGLTCTRKLPLGSEGHAFRIPISLMNGGKGPAQDVTVIPVAADHVELEAEPIRVGTLEPGKRHVVQVDGVVRNPAEQDALEVRVQWSNQDGAAQELHEIVALQGQRPDIDWAALEARDPYDLEPISDPAQLVGRDDIIRDITATLTTPRVGSLYIHGQKRVGKSSIAQTVDRILQDEHDFLVVFREVGFIAHRDPSVAVDSLVLRLAKDLERKSHGLFRSDSVKTNGSLAPLIECIEEFLDEHERVRICLMLDEFDQLPVGLFKRTEERQAFFNGLRSLAGLARCGLVLIGGERMRLISTTGSELNKFRSVPVDYLDRSSHWDDFVNLVRSPTRGDIEFSDGGVERIYALSAGNPYFAKLIAGLCYRQALDRRDAFVAPDDVDSAVTRSMASFGPQTFTHYWEDHLLETGDEADRRTLRRRRALLILSDCLRSAGEASEETLRRHSIQWGMEPGDLAVELAEFRMRKVLLQHDGAWRCVVQLFEEWLVRCGLSEIAIPESELEAEARAKRALERLAVSIEEIDDLIREWPTYRGHQKSSNEVQRYLMQFGDEQQQRLVFQILQHLTMYSSADENRLLKDAFDLVTEDMHRRLGTWTRGQLVVSFLGGPGRSGATRAKQFKDGGQLLPAQVVEPGALSEAVSSRESVTDIVFIDDLCGTGQSADEALRNLNGEGLLHFERPIVAHVVFMVALDGALDRVRSAASEVFGDYRVHAVHEFGPEGRCFDPEARVFSSDEDRMAAQALVKAFGERLEPKHPFGRDGCEALIVFSSSTPNNSLPILWKAKTDFDPLFPRV